MTIQRSTEITGKGTADDARPIVRISRMRDPPRITHPCDLNSRGATCPATKGREERYRVALFCLTRKRDPEKDTVSKHFFVFPQASGLVPRSLSLG